MMLLLVDYKPRFFYWEMVVFSRKLLVLVASITLPPVTSMMSRTLSLALIVTTCLVLPGPSIFELTIVLQVLTARFRPYLSSGANTLDITTQSVSLMSIMLAQYMHATSLRSEGVIARKSATLFFVGSNIALVLLHARLIVGPLLAKTRALVAKVRSVGNGKDEPIDDDDEPTKEKCVVSPIEAIGCKDDNDEPVKASGSDQELLHVFHAKSPGSVFAL